MAVKDFKNAYLFCFPLNIERNMRTLSEVKTFQLIWLKCCYNHSFKNISVTKRDRERINLSRDSYVRGLEALELLKIIIVDRKVGRSNQITVNAELLDKKSKDSVLKNGVTA